jgi:hypothetical protein
MEVMRGRATVPTMGSVNGRTEGRFSWQQVGTLWMSYNKSNLPWIPHGTANGVVGISIGQQQETFIFRKITKSIEKNRSIRLKCGKSTRIAGWSPTIRKKRPIAVLMKPSFPYPRRSLFFREDFTGFETMNWNNKDAFHKLICHFKKAETLYPILRVQSCINIVNSIEIFCKYRKREK